jgi:CDP-diacylglycerol--glycerol-3-phosphate 3-phosphatidyltransferase
MVAANAGIVIAADKIGKYKTTCQDFSIVILLVGAGFYEIFGDVIGVRVVNYIGLILFALATILTIISGINYIVKNINVLKV